MRLATALYFLLFLSLQSFGQGYLNNTSQWYDVVGDYFDKYYKFSNHQVAGDTIINGKDCLQMRSTYDHFSLDNYDVTDTTFLAQGVVETWILREENSSFYKVFSESYEELLYDFDLEIGDSISTEFFWEKTVLSIDTVMIGGEARRRYYVGQNGYLIEGVGFNHVGFKDGFAFGDERFAFIKCFSQDGETMELNLSEYVDEGVEIEECFLLPPLLTNIRTPQSFDLKVYPNPIHYFLVIETEITDLSLELFDSIGRSVAVFSRGANQIDLAGLPAGIYFLQAEKEGDIVIKKVVKM